MQRHGKGKPEEEEEEQTQQIDADKVVGMGKQHSDETQITQQPRANRHCNGHLLDTGEVDRCGELGQCSGLHSLFSGVEELECLAPG